MMRNGPVRHDHAATSVNLQGGDIQDILNATAIAISRSMARIGKADAAIRRCHAASLISQHAVKRARQRLARTLRT